MEDHAARHDDLLGSDIWLEPEATDSMEEEPPGVMSAAAGIRPRQRLALWLFLATAASMFIAGMNPGDTGLGLIPVWDRLTADQRHEALINGLTYAVALLAILGAHEMGHYLQSRRYRVPATLPFFIPLPISPFGTMGAVILQDGRSANRRMLFDIAVSGPLAGLVLAIPIAYAGIVQSEMKTIPPGGGYIRYGDPLVIQWMAEWIKQEPVGDGRDLILNPLLFAGWVGIFITALNLLPVGQLDGGHLLYTLIGRRAHWVAVAVLALGVGYMVYTNYYAYVIVVGLLLLMGPRHPPTANDNVPLGLMRHVVGWLTLAFIVVGFTPMPIVQM
jgi:membrane-associated protease RseP (regulator of RpoE activity)